MDEAALLDRLAEACGIGAEYRDIWGRPRRADPDAKRALLEAMGVRAATAEDLRRELHARETGPWKRTLPPVHVVRGPAAHVDVPLSLPERLFDRPLSVVLRRENGSRAEHAVGAGELPVTEHREIDGARYVRSPLRLPARVELGYHRVELHGGEGDPAVMTLIVAPGRCHVPAGLEGDGRVWGPAAQLYALRSGRDWGIGDFGGLRALVRAGGKHGAGVVGLNPMHALFPANPAHASPYSPSSRSFLQWVYLDVEAVPELAECDEARRLVAAPRFQARLVGLRERDMVDHDGVAAAKREVLEVLYRHFRRAHLESGSHRGREFRAFVSAAGPVLESYGAFEALEERFRGEGAWGWPVWPEEFRRPDSPEVARFAGEHRDRVEFFQWVQWECDRQLALAGRDCLGLGLKVGLYLDLAVSVDRAGFEAWSWQDVFALDAGMGAPPDDFNLLGQNWGLPPWIPERLREAAYRPFAECLRANMRHAGALRIDHVMGLMRAFWVPPGRPASEGAYVHYPFEDLLGVLALESVRNRCLVIGEDLGTVPDEVREALAPLGVLSYRLFYFVRREDGDFAPPSELPRQSLVAPSTHDLPTLAGWWRGQDITLRAELGLFPEERQREEQLAERSRDRARLLFALRREDLLPEDVDIDLARFPDEMTPGLMVAVHRYMARGPSMVLTFQLEDVIGQVEQVNLPGTTEEHPNWRRRLDVDLETLEHDLRLVDLAEGLRRERGEGTVRPPRGAKSGARPAAGPRIPDATYRVQLSRDMTFQDATRLVPYLAELGVSHVYASPFLQARPGSRHGYDIIDHASLNAEIGSREELDRFVETLRGHDMGLVLDVVPNHMGVGSDNAWWMDVLEHGPASPHAAFFDIDWRPHKLELRGKLLLPVLEDHYGRVLERGLLRLGFDRQRGAFEIAYHDHRLPVDPKTYPVVLSHDIERLQARLGRGDARFLELQSLIAALGNLPDRDQTAADRVRARLRDVGVLRRRLAGLASDCDELGSFVSANVARFNGIPEDPASFDLLDALLDEQAYRLTFWRTAADEINYRRFFDINDLAGLRMEQPEAFEATHRLVVELVRAGLIDGLRIDHPDGLYDPAGYYRRLAEALGGPADDGSPPVWTVAEKILASHERLPAGWMVHGTTGYDFCNVAGGLFVDPAGERALDRIYHRVLGRRAEYERLAYESKLLILETALASELTVLTDALDRISESDRRTRDFTRQRLRRALAEVIACFPVYRTYVTDKPVTDDDRRHVDWAVGRARKADRASDTSIYDFIRDVLVLDAVRGKDEAYRDDVLRFAGKFQQTTSPVTAKGLEDTTFYIYNRLLALNEVGGEPVRFGVSTSAFHRDNRERAESHPHSMLTTSTHDSKRSEDVRARIAVLSEIPERWDKAVQRWSAINRPHRGVVDRRHAPSRNDEYALYQTLVGVWPAEPPDAVALAELRDRVRRWAIKSAREAKVHTSWIEPEEGYERATTAFVDAILAEPGGPFPRELAPLVRFVAGVGALGSLAQTTLKLTSPGVPDIYQGNELPVLALVDPDNRRPVDFEHCRRTLDELKRFTSVPDAELAERAGELARRIEDGRAKLYVTWRTLGLRRQSPAVFRDGAYRALEVAGELAEHAVAFVRELDEAGVAVVVPRLVAGLCDPADGRLLGGTGSWKDTRVLLDGRHRNVLTGETVEGGPDGVALGRLLARFPVAVLVRS